MFKTFFLCLMYCPTLKAGSRPRCTWSVWSLVMPRVVAAPPPDGYDGAAASSAGAELNAGELPEAVPLHGEQQQQQQPALSFSTR